MRPAIHAAAVAADEAQKCHSAIQQLPCRQGQANCGAPEARMGPRQLLVTIIALAIGIWMYFAQEFYGQRPMPRHPACTVCDSNE